ncbi:MAG TPA: hypothetical protein VIG33_12400 [Pseudobdellovibrionaceae bacterium]|jgi:hypothetical protein
MQIMFQACSKTRFGSDEWRRDGFPNEAEHGRYKNWAAQKGLNKYGDPKDMVYMGGDPLFYSRMSLYQYASTNHPQKPWNEKAK